jgi:hypothetical protein
MRPPETLKFVLTHEEILAFVADTVVRKHGLSDRLWRFTATLEFKEDEDPMDQFQMTLELTEVKE